MILLFLQAGAASLLLLGVQLQFRQSAVELQVQTQSAGFHLAGKCLSRQEVGVCDKRRAGG